MPFILSSSSFCRIFPAVKATARLETFTYQLRCQKHWALYPCTVIVTYRLYSYNVYMTLNKFKSIFSFSHQHGREQLILADHLFRRNLCRNITEVPSPTRKTHQFATLPCLTVGRQCVGLYQRELDLNLYLRFHTVLRVVYTPAFLTISFSVRELLLSFSTIKYQSQFQIISRSQIQAYKYTEYLVGPGFAIFVGRKRNVLFIHNDTTFLQLYLIFISSFTC